MNTIDIAIPNYNQARFLPSAVQSVLAQGIDDIRVLIIDNCSTDNSLEVAEELAERDGRISLVRHTQNVGAIASFNEAIDWASATFFTILAADDQLADGSLRRSLAVMEANPAAAFAYGR